MSVSPIQASGVGLASSRPVTDSVRSGTKSEPVVPQSRTHTRSEVKEGDDAYVIRTSNRTVSYDEDGNKVGTVSRAATRIGADGTVETKVVAGTFSYDENGNAVKDVQRY